MVGVVVLAVLIICAVVWIAPLALVRSWTEVVGNVPSPDGKWDVVLMVRNAGATTNYSTQLSVVPAGGRVSREIALCRPGNVFIADGNHGAVAVNHLAMRRGRKIAKVAMARKLAVRLYWMWRKGWDYEQMKKFGSHAGQPGNRDGVKSITE
jgi:hypothetical protein